MFFIPFQYFISPYVHPTWTRIPIQVVSTSIAQSNSPYPPVDTHQLKESARHFQSMMQQANLLVDKIIDSKQFAHDLMQAAQHSNETEVKKLITSTGITIQFGTKFTPDGITITFSDREGGCCKLTMALNW